MPRHSITNNTFSLTNPRVRVWLYQISALLTLAGICSYLIHNTIANLTSRGIKSGFTFLNDSAGFGIIQHLINFEQGDSYGRVFIIGLCNTLLVSALCIIFASALGFVIGLARLSDNLLLRKLASIYIEIFRNIPPLLQIFFWYFAVLRNLPGPRQSLGIYDSVFLSNRGLYIPSPLVGEGWWPLLGSLLVVMLVIIFIHRHNLAKQIYAGRTYHIWLSISLVLIAVVSINHLLFGPALHWQIPALRGFNFRGGIVIIPELAALTLALSVYTSTFIAEIIRSGIQSVPHGQYEAAYSLALPKTITLRHVILPQALKMIIPPLTNQYLNVVKNSSLAAAIGYPDMVSLFAGTVLNQTGQAIETIAITMSVYLIISLAISFLMNIYNQHVALIER